MKFMNIAPKLDPGSEVRNSGLDNPQRLHVAMWYILSP